MQETGKKAIVLVENLFEDYELIYPYYRLIEAGAETRLVGPEADKAYQGKSGTKATSGLAAGDIDPKDWDALVIPGGYAPDHMRRHRSMIDGSITRLCTSASPSPLWLAWRISVRRFR